MTITCNCFNVPRFHGAKGLIRSQLAPVGVAGATVHLQMVFYSSRDVRFELVTRVQVSLETDYSNHIWA